MDNGNEFGLNNQNQNQANESGLPDLNALPDLGGLPDLNDLPDLNTLPDLNQVSSTKPLPLQTGKEAEESFPVTPSTGASASFPTAQDRPWDNLSEDHHLYGINPKIPDSSPYSRKSLWERNENLKKSNAFSIFGSADDHVEKNSDEEYLDYLAQHGPKATDEMYANRRSRVYKYQEDKQKKANKGFFENLVDQGFSRTKAYVEKRTKDLTPDNDLESQESAEFSAKLKTISAISDKEKRKEAFSKVRAEEKLRLKRLNHDIESRTGYDGLFSSEGGMLDWRLGFDAFSDVATTIPRSAFGLFHEGVFQLTDGEKGKSFEEAFSKEEMIQSGYGPDEKEDGTFETVSESMVTMKNALVENPWGTLGMLAEESATDPWMAVSMMTGGAAAPAWLSNLANKTKMLQRLEKLSKVKGMKFLATPVKNAQARMIAKSGEIAAKKIEDLSAFAKAKRNVLNVMKHYGKEFGKEFTGGVVQGIIGNEALLIEKPWLATGLVEGVEEGLFGMAFSSMPGSSVNEDLMSPTFKRKINDAEGANLNEKMFNAYKNGDLDLTKIFGEGVYKPDSKNENDQKIVKYVYNLQTHLDNMVKLQQSVIDIKGGATGSLKQFWDSVDWVMSDLEQLNVESINAMLAHSNMYSNGDVESRPIMVETEFNKDGMYEPFEADLAPPRKMSKKEIEMLLDEWDEVKIEDALSQRKKIPSVVVENKLNTEEQSKYKENIQIRKNEFIASGRQLSKKDIDELTPEQLAIYENNVSRRIAQGLSYELDSERKQIFLRYSDMKLKKEWDSLGSDADLFAGKPQSHPFVKGATYRQQSFNDLDFKSLKNSLIATSKGDTEAAFKNYKDFRLDYELARAEYDRDYKEDLPLYARILIDRKAMKKALLLNNGEKALVTSGGAWQYVSEHPEFLQHDLVIQQIDALLNIQKELDPGNPNKTFNDMQNAQQISEMYSSLEERLPRMTTEEFAEASKVFFEAAENLKGLLLGDAKFVAKQKGMEKHQELSSLQIEELQGKIQLDFEDPISSVTRSIGQAGSNADRFGEVSYSVGNVTVREYKDGDNVVFEINGPDGFTRSVNTEITHSAKGDMPIQEILELNPFLMAINPEDPQAGVTINHAALNEARRTRDLSKNEISTMFGFSKDYVDRLDESIDFTERLNEARKAFTPNSLDVYHELMELIKLDLNKQANEEEATLLHSEQRFLNFGESIAQRIEEAKSSGRMNAESVYELTEFMGSPIEFTNDSSIGARNVEKGKKILLNPELIFKKFEEKAWTNPRLQKDNSKANPYPANQFTDINEWLTFVLLHEKMHETVHQDNVNKESRGAYESRVNEAALAYRKNEQKKAMSSLEKDLGFSLEEFDGLKVRDENGKYTRNFRAFLMQEIAEGKVHATQLPSFDLLFSSYAGLESSIPVSKSAEYLDAISESNDSFIQFPMIKNSYGNDVVWLSGKYKDIDGNMNYRVRTTTNVGDFGGYTQFLVNAEDMVNWISDPHKFSERDFRFEADYQGSHVSPTLSSDVGNRDKMKAAGVPSDAQYIRMKRKMLRGKDTPKNGTKAVKVKDLIPGRTFEAYSWNDGETIPMVIDWESSGGIDIMVARATSRQYPLVFPLDLAENIHIPGTASNSELADQSTTSPTIYEKDFEAKKEDEAINDMTSAQLNEEERILNEAIASSTVQEVERAQGVENPQGIEPKEPQATHQDLLAAKEKLEKIKKVKEVKDREIQIENNKAEANFGKGFHPATPTVSYSENTVSQKTQSDQKLDMHTPHVQSRKPNIAVHEKRPMITESDVRKILDDDNSTFEDHQKLLGYKNHKSLSFEGAGIFGQIIKNFFGDSPRRISAVDFNALTGDVKTAVGYEIEANWELNNDNKDITAEILEKVHGRDAEVQSGSLELYNGQNKDLVVANTTAFMRDNKRRFNTDERHKNVVEMRDFDIRKGIDVLRDGGLLVAAVDPDFMLQDLSYMKSRGTIIFAEHMEGVMQSSEPRVVMAFVKGRVNLNFTNAKIQNALVPPRSAGKVFSDLNSGFIGKATMTRSLQSEQALKMDLMQDELRWAKSTGSSDIDSRAQGINPLRIGPTLMSKHLASKGGKSSDPRSTMYARDMKNFNEQVITALAETAGAVAGKALKNKERIGDSDMGYNLQIVMDEPFVGALQDKQAFFPPLYAWDASGNVDEALVFYSQNGEPIPVAENKELIDFVNQQNAKFPDRSVVDLGAEYSSRFVPIVYRNSKGDVSRISIGERVTVDNSHNKLKTVLENSLPKIDGRKPVVKVLNDLIGKTNETKNSIMSAMANGEIDVLITDSKNSLPIYNYRGGSKISFGENNTGNGQIDIVPQPEMSDKVLLKNTFSEAELSEIDENEKQIQAYKAWDKETTSRLYDLGIRDADMKDRISKVVAHSGTLYSSQDPDPIFNDFEIKTFDDDIETSITASYNPEIHDPLQFLMSKIPMESLETRIKEIDNEINEEKSALVKLTQKIEKAEDPSLKEELSRKLKMRTDFLKQDVEKSTHFKDVLDLRKEIRDHIDQQYKTLNEVEVKLSKWNRDETNSFIGKIGDDIYNIFKNQKTGYPDLHFVNKYLEKVQKNPKAEESRKKAIRKINDHIDFINESIGTPRPVARLVYGFILDNELRTQDNNGRKSVLRASSDALDTYMGVWMDMHEKVKYAQQERKILNEPEFEEGELKRFGNKLSAHDVGLDFKREGSVPHSEEFFDEGSTYFKIVKMLRSQSGIDHELLDKYAVSAFGKEVDHGELLTYFNNVITSKSKQNKKQKSSRKEKYSEAIRNYDMFEGAMDSKTQGEIANKKWESMKSQEGKVDKNALLFMSGGLAAFMAPSIFNAGLEEDDQSLMNKGALIGAYGVSALLGSLKIAHMKSKMGSVRNGIDIKNSPGSYSIKTDTEANDLKKGIEDNILSKGFAKAFALIETRLDKAADKIALLKTGGRKFDIKRKLSTASMRKFQTYANAMHPIDMALRNMSEWDRQDVMDSFHQIIKDGTKPPDKKLSAESKKVLLTMVRMKKLLEKAYAEAGVKDQFGIDKAVSISPVKVNAQQILSIGKTQGFKEILSDLKNENNLSDDELIKRFARLIYSGDENFFKGKVKLRNMKRVSSTLDNLSNDFSEITNIKPEEIRKIIISQEPDWAEKTAIERGFGLRKMGLRGLERFESADYETFHSRVRKSISDIINAQTFGSNLHELKTWMNHLKELPEYRDNANEPNSEYKLFERTLEREIADQLEILSDPSERNKLRNDGSFIDSFVDNWNGIQYLKMVAHNPISAIKNNILGHASAMSTFGMRNWIRGAINAATGTTLEEANKMQYLMDTLQHGLEENVKGEVSGPYETIKRWTETPMFETSLMKGLLKIPGIDFASFLGVKKRGTSGSGIPIPESTFNILASGMLGNADQTSIIMRDLERLPTFQLYKTLNAGVYITAAKMAPYVGPDLVNKAKLGDEVAINDLKSVFEDSELQSIFENGFSQEQNERLGFYIADISQGTSARPTKSHGWTQGAFGRFFSLFRKTPFRLTKEFTDRALKPAIEKGDIRNLSKWVGYNAGGAYLISMIMRSAGLNDYADDALENMGITQRFLSIALNNGMLLPGGSILETFMDESLGASKQWAFIDLLGGANVRSIANLTTFALDAPDPSKSLFWSAADWGFREMPFFNNSRKAIESRMNHVPLSFTEIMNEMESSEPIQERLKNASVVAQDQFESMDINFGFKNPHPDWLTNSRWKNQNLRKKRNNDITSGMKGSSGGMPVSDLLVLQEVIKKDMEGMIPFSPEWFEKGHELRHWKEEGGERFERAKRRFYVDLRDKGEEEEVNK